MTRSTLPVRFVRLSGRPLDGTPIRLRGPGAIEIDDRAVLLHHDRPLAELPEWAVGLIVGGAVAYYLLLQLVPAAWVVGIVDPTTGPLVPAMAAALASWFIVRATGPRRREQLRLHDTDVGAVRIDRDRCRALLLTRQGQLIGLELDELEPLVALAHERWPTLLQEGAIRPQLVGRRTIVLAAVAGAVALALWLAPG